MLLILLDALHAPAWACLAPAGTTLLLQDHPAKGFLILVKATKPLL